MGAGGRWTLPRLPGDLAGVADVDPGSSQHESRATRFLWLDRGGDRVSGVRRDRLAVAGRAHRRGGVDDRGHRVVWRGPWRLRRRRPNRQGPETSIVTATWSW